MNKGLRLILVKVSNTSRKGCPWENSDLMNKGLRLYYAAIARQQSDWLIGENSDLMNKGLRLYVQVPLIRQTISSAERILTWWIKDCDCPSSGHTRILGLRWENSDLMNKGLRRPQGRVLLLYTFRERILTWWIKDCDLPIRYDDNSPLYHERILTWWIKDCDSPVTGEVYDNLFTREFWLDE